MKKIAMVALLLLVAAASLLTAQSMKKGFEWLTKQSEDPLLPGVNPLGEGNTITRAHVYRCQGGSLERFGRGYKKHHRGLHRQRREAGAAWPKPTS
jgi:hypothetical protein